MRSPMFYKPSIFRRILWGLGITVGVLAILLLIFFIITLFMKPGQVKVEDKPTVTELSLTLDASSTYQNIATDSMLYMYNSESAKPISIDGKQGDDIPLKMSAPTVSVKGEYALFYDLGAYNALVLNKTKQVTTITVKEKIQMAVVNSSGYVLLVTEGDMHKSSVRVFTPNAEEVFKWNSGQLAVIGADIADNNKDISISALNTADGKINNHIIMFNLAKEKPFTNDVYENVLYSVLRYSGSHLYCIGTQDTLIYNGYGKCSGTTDYADREMTKFVLDDGLLLLAFSGSEEQSGAYAEIKSYNNRGEETGSFTSRQQFDFLVAEGGRVVLNNGRYLSILNNHCKEKLQINLDVDLRDFLFLGGKTRGVGITASGAALIHLGA